MSSTIHGQDESASGGRGEDLPTTPELRDDLRTKVLPHLPVNLMEGLVNELQTDFGVYSLDDIRFAGENDFEKIKVLKGVQKNRFLEYAESVRNPSKKTQTRNITATGFENLTDKPLNVHLEGNTQYTVVANDPGDGSSGDRVAKGFVGHGDFKMEGDAVYYVDSGDKKTDFTKVRFVLWIKNELETVPEEKIQKLVEELEKKQGVHGSSDLQYVDLENMKKLKSLVGVELESFLGLVKKAKDWAKQADERKKPPSSMYG